MCFPPSCMSVVVWRKETGIAGKSKAPGNVWNGVCFPLSLYWALMHLALSTACCCSFSITNTGSPHRNGLMELEGLHTEGWLEKKERTDRDELSVKLLAGTALIPTSYIVQVMKMNAWQQISSPYKSSAERIFRTWPEALISSSTIQDCIVYFAFQLSSRNYLRKEKSNLINSCRSPWLSFSTFQCVCYHLYTIQSMGQ